ncbi:MAG: hypothetical protein N3F05_02920 [Candidatus Diapherotrites archaeon]|nr:hypothetical protein [Candidatus Diapherotrites archaeon]
MANSVFLPAFFAVLQNILADLIGLPTPADLTLIAVIGVVIAVIIVIVIILLSKRKGQKKAQAKQSEKNANK